MNVKLESLFPLNLGKINLRRVGGKAVYTEIRDTSFVPNRGERMQVYADKKGNRYQLEQMIPWPSNPKMSEYLAYAGIPESQKKILISAPETIVSDDFRKGPGITQVKEKDWVYNLRRV
ncbi:MAG: hypothetical protein V1678_01070 [Candidatus Aenigmatarchaeota archaeon]